MPFAYDLYVSGLLISFLITALLSVYISLRKRSDAADLFLLTISAIDIWIFLSLARVVVPIEYQPIVLTLKNASVFLISPFWLAFALDYSGRLQAMERIRIAVYSTFLLLFVLFVTNPIHNLLWDDYYISNSPFAHLSIDQTQLYFIAGGIALAVNFAAATILIVASLTSNRVSKYRLTALFVGSSIPTLGSATRLFVLTRVESRLGTLDYGALLVFVIGIFTFINYRGFLNYVPFPRFLIIEEVSKPVVVTDERGRIADYNGKLIELYPEAKGQFGRSLSEVIPEIVDSEEIDVQLNGERKIYSIQRFNFREYEEGNTYVLTDVTELKEKENLLERQTNQLEDFSGTVSHDLRNPLSIAKGFAELENPEENKETIRESLNRAQDIINESLELAREGSVIREKSPVNVAKVAEDAWGVIETGDSARLSVESDGGIIMSDEERLRRLLKNLFRNSVEHGPDSVTVRIGVAGDCLWVEDDGPGIPEERRDDVIESGYTTNDEGTGLGLSIVQKIATAHNWEINITSSKEGGARFEFTGVKSTHG